MDPQTAKDLVKIFEGYTPFQMARLQQTVKDYIRRYKNTKDKLDALDDFYDIIDEANAKYIETSPHKISCKKGCSFCCNIRVIGFQIEADYILEYCKTNNIPIDVEKLKRQSVIKDDIAYYMSPDRRCVFLSDEGLCNIYEVRPSSCRNYMVTNPPEQCNTDKYPSGGTIAAFNINAAMVQFALADMLKPGDISEYLLNSINNYKEPLVEDGDK